MSEPTTNATMCECGHPAIVHNSVTATYKNAELCRGVTIVNGMVAPSCKCECFLAVKPHDSASASRDRHLATCLLLQLVNDPPPLFVSTLARMLQSFGVDHALSLRLTESEQAVARLRRELDEALAELSAVRVLDAWARKHRYNVPQVQNSMRSGDLWELFAFSENTGMRMPYAGATPARARIVAAAALLAEDPGLANA
jgi:hypothetical protein